MRKHFLVILSVASIFVFGCNSGKSGTAKVISDSAVTRKVTENARMITAKIFVKKENMADFIKAARVMIDSTLKEAGCESYMLYQNPYEPASLIFVETYKNQAAIDAHFASSYFKAFGPVIKDWLAKPTELKIYDIAGVK